MLNFDFFERGLGIVFPPGPPFHFQKYADQKYLWCSRTSLDPSKSIIKKDGFSTRFLTIVIWNLKFENNIFDGRLVVNETFSQTEFIIGKSNFDHIMHFH